MSEGYFLFLIINHSSQTIFSPPFFSTSKGKLPGEVGGGRRRGERRDVKQGGRNPFFLCLFFKKDIELTAVDQ